MINTAPPEYLYRYRSTNSEHEARTSDIFLKCEQYYAKPSEFNDPFDGNIVLDLNPNHNRTINSIDEIMKVGEQYRQDKVERKEAEKSIKSLAKNYLVDEFFELFSEKFTEGLIRNLRVLCFCERGDDIRMWSHYANGHRGFCLKFRTEGLERNKLNLGSVAYVPNYPRTDLKDMDDEKLLNSVVFAKSDDWEYELEWRNIMHSDVIGSDGRQRFDPDCLVGVIFGCVISDTAKENILNWIQRGPSQPELYQAERKKLDFGLDIVRFD